MKYFLVVFVLAFSSSMYASSTIRVTDYSGNDITIKQHAKRIIALAPHVVENIYSAGAGDLIVGAVSYADYPQAATKIPRVGSTQGFSAEAIVALKPDLIIAWSSSLSPKLLQQFKQLGFPVYMDEPRKLEDVAKSIRDIGVLTGHIEQSEQSVQAYLLSLENIKKEFSDRSTVSVLYQVWDSPLQTISGEHIISDVIRLCGGENVFSEAVVIAPKISIESVLSRNPKVIVASGMGEERPDWLERWKQWPSLTAVKEDNLFFVPPDLLQRHTVRLIQGAQLLCRQLDSVRG